MKKDNKSDYTINFTRKASSFLGKKTSLAEPEAVKLVIAELKTSDGYKRNLCIAYNKYAKFYSIAWNMPKYREPERNITPPTKEKVQMLIAEAGVLLSTKLQLSSETGLRPVELARLKVRHLDLDHKSREPNHSQERQSKNHTNNREPKTTTTRTHHTRELKPRRFTVQRNRRRPLW